jgi:hypothetical protein
LRRRKRASPDGGIMVLLGNCSTPGPAGHTSERSVIITG